MIRYRHSSYHPLWAPALLAALVGCAELEKEQPVVVSTSGPHSVLVGETIALTASTANGVDGAYQWKSETPAIVSVDMMGAVKGLAPGEGRITATGTKTRGVATHAVVVIEAPANLGNAVPNYEKWRMSAHADPTAEAFVHWRKEGAVPAECARCHSGPGFVDFLGGDGSERGKVEGPAPESVITCVTCHNAAADTLSEVTFPSGATVKGLGGGARCMTCHQGRASGKDVDAQVMKAGVTDDDTASPMLRFTNIHYYPAAATLYASRAAGGYQYAGQAYDARFRHAPGYDTCTGCHDPHSAKVKFDQCVGCHPAAKDVGGARTIRMISSHARDYDGDGNVEEGVAHEIDGLREKVLAAMFAYGKQRMTPLCFGKAYPYWFKDTNADGKCGDDEQGSMNGFGSWTPRLLRAAYNYQMASVDPGAFAHNAKYIMQLLHDSITNLNAAITEKVEMTKAVRGDVGHFDGASQAARRWDATEAVEATCSKCHSGSTGFRFFVEHGVSTEVAETANGLDCATCHTSFGDEYALLAVKQTVFPSGVVAALPGNDNLCSNCHSGRESKATVDAAIARNERKFLNVHYLPAASVRQGSQAHVGYEYDGKTYAGPLTHQGGVQCTSCHDPIASKHTFTVADTWTARCQTCHADANRRPETLRLTHKADYDGDGNATETLPAELEGMAARLLAAMRAASPGLCYAGGVYPYFFKNDPASGKPTCTPAEATSATRFAAWTPELMRAAHNYQLHHVDPGAWAHNFSYVAQLLHDSIEALRGSTASMVRP